MVIKACLLTSLLLNAANSDAADTRNLDTSTVTFTQATTPANPSASKNKLYFKSDGKLYELNASGVETVVSTGGAAGSDTQVQYNNAGAFAGSPNFTFNAANRSITVNHELDFLYSPVGEEKAVSVNSVPNGTDGNGSALIFTAGSAARVGDGGYVIFNTGSGGHTSGDGGHLTLEGGFADNGAGGYAEIFGGLSANGSGGAITLLGGESVSGGNGGGITMSGGESVSGGAGGSFAMYGGFADDVGPGGAFDIEGGAGGGTSGDGGSFTMIGGQAHGNGNGGSFHMAGGDVVGNGNGGQFTLSAGSAGLVGAGGGLAFSTGNGGATSGDSGSMSFFNGSATSGAGGSMLFIAGSSDNGNGGNVIFTAGSSAAGGTNGNIAFRDVATGTQARFDTSGLSAGNKTFTFPNANGSFALNSATLLTNQTGSATVKTFTPPYYGPFTIGCAINITAFTAGTLSFTVDYKDPGGTARTLTVPLIALAGTIATTTAAATEASCVSTTIITDASTNIVEKIVATAFTGTYFVAGSVLY